MSYSSDEEAKQRIAEELEKLHEQKRARRKNFKECWNSSLQNSYEARRKQAAEQKQQNIESLTQSMLANSPEKSSPTPRLQRSGLFEEKFEGAKRPAAFQSGPAFSPDPTASLNGSAQPLNEPQRSSNTLQQKFGIGSCLKRNF